MQNRLLSLDVFRGMTVALMILVNNPGDWGHIYAPLEHATWNGCTPTDWVFPFFLFIVGVSITFAKVGSWAATGKRSAKLFGLGLFLALFPRFNFETVRIMGVLQRIAIVYFCCTLLYRHTSLRVQIGVFWGILLAYCYLLMHVPVPAIGIANLAPETNWGAWLDRLILTEKHLWKAAKVWDPEGLLSTLPAIGTGLAGMWAGATLQHTEWGVLQKLKMLFGVGLALVAVGWVWDWSGFPINKALWTSSYVCFTAGLACMLLAVLYWLIDVQGYKRWTVFFEVYGVNAITVFFLSGLIPRILTLIKIPVSPTETPNLQQYLFQKGIAPFFPDPYMASLAGALTFVLLWFLILWAMYKKEIFIKV